MGVEFYVDALVNYGTDCGLVEETDRLFVRNRILEAMRLSDYHETVPAMGSGTPEGSEEAGNIKEAERNEKACSPGEAERNGEGRGIKKNGRDGETGDIGEVEFSRDRKHLPAEPGERLERILAELLKAAQAEGIVPPDSVTYRDLFDTKLMGCLTPRPSEVIREFRRRYADSPEQATDWLYKFSQDCDYIRRYRIRKDRKWTVESEYGTLDITINLSKPEKDPLAIAAARTAKQGAYPKCQLCRENEGYAGRPDHPARQTLRAVPVPLDGEDWFLQYSPYVYYQEHCIAFCGEHRPMKINRSSFVRLFDFLDQFPHYFIGSNADLPIVGGSILTHDHFQGGRYEFAMERAEIAVPVRIKGFEDVNAGIVKWPLSVLRIRCPKKERLVELADHVLTAWRNHTDEAAGIFAKTGGERHNTITPIARMRDGWYELDLVLRNNLTTEEYPLGVFHPHPELHHIKKENIGLIEVMGLAVLPSRLMEEMEAMKAGIRKRADFREDENTERHAAWLDGIIANHPGLWRAQEEELYAVLQEEIGKVFVRVLEDAGVYRFTPDGTASFRRFLKTL